MGSRSTGSQKLAVPNGWGPRRVLGPVGESEGMKSCAVVGAVRRCGAVASGRRAPCTAQAKGNGYCSAGRWRRCAAVVGCREMLLAECSPISRHVASRHRWHKERRGSLPARVEVRSKTEGVVRLTVQRAGTRGAELRAVNHAHMSR